MKEHIAAKWVVSRDGMVVAEHNIVREFGKLKLRNIDGMPWLTIRNLRQFMREFNRRIPGAKGEIIFPPK